MEWLSLLADNRHTITGCTYWSFQFIRRVTKIFHKIRLEFRSKIHTKVTFSQSEIGGFSDDSEDFEVSRLSNLSGFRPINDIADLSFGSDDCHPLLAQLPNAEGKKFSKS